MASPVFKYQKEVLLREIYEYIPAWTYLLLAIILVFASELAFAIPVVAFTIAGLFLARSWVLFSRGYKLKQYQQNLTRLPMYEMKSDDIPISNKVHFLGMGFEWTQRHTQRIYDLNLPQNSKYKEYSPLYKKAREMEIALEHNRYMQWLINFTASQNRFNPVKPAPPLQGQPYIHAVGLYEEEERLMQELDERGSHMIVLGTTGVGKTRAAEIIITSDIRRGDTVIVIDPKGDADLMLRCYSEAIKSGREEHFYLFHLGYPEISAQYNPVGQFMRITEVATRIANQMPGEGQSAAFREFVWGYVNQIAKGLVGIGQTPSFPLIKRYSHDLEPLYIEFMTKLLKDKIPDFEQKVKKYTEVLNLKAEERRQMGFNHDISAIKRNKDAIAYYCLFKESVDKIVFTNTELDIAQSLTKAFITDQQYLSKLVASLDPFLEKMTTGAVSQLIAPDFTDPSKDVFDWGTIIQSGGIVYIGLDALSDQEVARTVGAAMLADLTSQYGRIYKEGIDHGLPDIGKTAKRKIRVHIDEANEPADQALLPTLNKARGAGVTVTLYTQTLSDLEARLGNKAEARQMLGNLNTVMTFRVQDEETARIFTEKQPEVEVDRLVSFSSAAASSDISSGIDFTSNQQSRITQSKRLLITTNDLIQLPKGQFFITMNGNRLYKGRVPLLKQDDSGIPDNIRAVADAMRDSYKSAIPNWYNYKESFNPIQILNEGEKTDVMGQFIRELSSVYVSDEEVV
ncbi:MAG: type IV conjugative transfer system coupling protein TraD [Gammaproteobacteria bacterium]|nr:type IV conjugative transfer system coupling protein TraD [Gammaproteobacteria bacterium]